MAGNIALERVRTATEYDLFSLFEQCDDENCIIDDSIPQHSKTVCSYYEPSQFRNNIGSLENQISLFHLNCRGLSANWESFFGLMCDLSCESFMFDIIGISEVYRTDKDQRLKLDGYHDLITRTRDDGFRGGVGIFIKENLNYIIREDIGVFIPHVFESIFIEIKNKNSKNILIGVIYRPNSQPKADIDIFSSTISDIMNKINNEDKICAIMGDMNIDLLKFESHPKTSEYLDTIYSNGFFPVINKPTRLSTTSATLIDHIYSNNITSNAQAGIILTDVADHFGVFHAFDYKTKKLKQQELSRRCMSDRNIATFRSKLNTLSYQTVFDTDCPNEAYDKFMNIYTTSFKNAFPIKKIKPNKKFIKREPWFSQGLLVSSRKRNKLLHNKISNPTQINVDKFKKFNALYNKLKRMSKINHYKDAFEENKHDIKQTWSILNKAIGKQQNKNNFPPEFVIDGQSITDRGNIANAFNEYFSNIGTLTGENVKNVTKGFNEFMPAPCVESMFLEPVESESIIQTARKLKSKSSTGHDDLSTKIIKLTINEIAEPLAHIINMSLTSGIVPTNMKIAKVIPIYKASDPTSIKNYRPVSLLPAFSKILEKIMYTKVVKFLNSKNIFYKHQYGFREKHSTIHPIIHLLNHCAEAANKRIPEPTLAIFCDLSKAFDVINHKILLQKLNIYGIRGIVNKWFENYLTGRKQYVSLDDSNSTMQSINCGVPQGSILGPLLYLIYVNDIQYACTGNILSFADDTTLYLSNSNINTLYKDANMHINNLFIWFCSNKLSLNANKTKYILLRPKRSKHNIENMTLAIDEIPLKRIGENCDEKFTKFLGLYFDENLTFKNHITQVNSKISRAIFAIKQCNKLLPKESMRTLYFALIHPHIQYSIIAWGNASPSVLRRTVLLQKRAIRLINKAAYNSHTEPLFKQSNILKLTDLHKYQLAMLMFDFTNHNLPSSFNDMFKFNRDIQQTHETRQSSQIYIPRALNKFVEQLPLFTLPNIWNSLIHTINIETTRSLFKRNMKTTLIEHYNNIVRCINRNCRDCFPQVPL